MDRRQFITATAATLAAPLALSVPARAVTGSQTIVELAAATPDLSTLVTAVQAAGLVDTLSADGNFTVFAPTNRAFEHLPHGVLDSLLADTAALTDVLTYHVSADYYPAEALIGQSGVLPTVQGSTIRMNGRGGGVHLNGNIAVTTADVFASNGVVHIIDGVLLPH
ncbi:fasciclin domain-containing protein [Roseibacterium beibuensis]|uniref:Fasciclin domain-containing protein n=1 Tax=[Roseibacterium] beibuensis TaxID=1193142 RepID=A0ABP9LPV8_9RHOB|nr:fasciclin domain-containing protein [Roseibacterium beibuensis]MCS6626189.1 fasciclin domain-containing protein [Roseibacterium beibuensis]